MNLITGQKYTYTLYILKLNNNAITTASKVLSYYYQSTDLKMYKNRNY